MTNQQIYFTEEEHEMLNKHLKFYQSLARGTRIPKTPAQKHFVLVCKGKALTQTEHERVYIKYRMRNFLYLREQISKRVLGRQHHEKKQPGNHYISSTYKSTISIDKDRKKSERENISRILLRQKKIRDATF